METLESKKLTTLEYQRIVVVILKNDFGATFAQIAEVLKLKSTEAKELYMHLIRQMENPELSEKTQITTI